MILPLSDLPGLSLCRNLVQGRTQHPQILIGSQWVVTHAIRAIFLIHSYLTPCPPMIWMVPDRTLQRRELRNGPGRSRVTWHQLRSESALRTNNPCKHQAGTLKTCSVCRHRSLSMPPQHSHMVQDHDLSSSHITRLSCARRTVACPIQRYRSWPMPEAWTMILWTMWQVRTLEMEEHPEKWTPEVNRYSHKPTPIP